MSPKQLSAYAERHYLMATAPFGAPGALLAAGQPSGEDSPKPPGAAAAQPDGLPPSAAGRATVRLDFRGIYETELDFVWRSLLLLGVARNAVEDAAQEVFSVVYRQLDGFEGRSSLRTWLFAIVQRVAANQRRTVRRKQRALEPLDDGTACRLPTPHARAEAAEAIDLVQRFCNTLDTERRALFVLALLEGLPASEVSHALGIPTNTVYSRVRLLREGLRRTLQGERGESEQDSD